MNNKIYVEKSGELGAYTSHQNRKLPEDSAHILFHPAVYVPSMLLTAGTVGQEVSKILQNTEPLPDNGNTYMALSTLNALAALGTIYFLSKEKAIPNK